MHTHTHGGQDLAGDRERCARRKKMSFGYEHLPRMILRYRAIIFFIQRVDLWEFSDFLKSLKTSRNMTKRLPTWAAGGSLPLEVAQF